MERLDLFLNRLMRGVEIMAGLCLAVVTVVIFASALGRYLFAFPIPDSFDIARLLLGITVMWGFAVLAFTAQHISVDLLAEALPAAWRRRVDILAQSVLLGFNLLLAYKLFTRLASAYASNEATFDLRLSVWPFVTVIWAGAIAAAVMAAIRLFFLLVRSEPATAGKDDIAYD